MLTAEQLATLEDIHRETFDNFEYVPDPVKWKTPEYWVSVKEVVEMLAEVKQRGDCEDYAAIVRYKCRLAGIKTRLVFCWVPPQGEQPGGYHIGVEADGWFSDCNHIFLIERDRVPYIWIELSGFEPGETWHYIKPFDPTQPWPHLAAC